MDGTLGSNLGPPFGKFTAGMTVCGYVLKDPRQQIGPAVDCQVTESYAYVDSCPCHGGATEPDMVLSSVTSGYEYFTPVSVYLVPAVLNLCFFVRYTSLTKRLSRLPGVALICGSLRGVEIEWPASTAFSGGE